MLILHVRKLDPFSVARRIYEEQLNRKWPGLAREGVEICDEMGIKSVHSTRMEKQAYRDLITRACHKLKEIRIRKQADGKDKCPRISSEVYGKKNYLEKRNINKVRKMLRTRFGLLPFAGNYSHDGRYARTEWLCKCKKAREEEGHLLSGKCDTYGYNKDKHMDLNSDEDLVKFFQEILDRRDELEELEKDGE